MVGVLGVLLDLIDWLGEYFCKELVEIEEWVIVGF